MELKNCLVIHLGVYGSSSTINIEQCGYNEKIYCVPDMDGNLTTSDGMCICKSNAKGEKI